MEKTGEIVKCKICGKEKYFKQSLLKRGRGIYCSMSCRSKYAVKKMLEVRGENWRKNVLEASKKRRKLWEIDPTTHPHWKGDNVGYFGVHNWIEKVAGRPKKCMVCGLDDKKRIYHWANISGLYRRDINDWKRMCVSCHRKFDYRKKDRKLSSSSLTAGKVRV